MYSRREVMAARKGCCIGGCFLKIIITIIIIIALLAGTVLVVSNMTIEKLGLSDRNIGGQTLREMGLAQIKLKDVVSMLNKLLNTDENTIITNPFNPIADKATADSSAGDIGVPMDGDSPDYLSLLGDTPITTAYPTLVTFSDTEVAYILNNMVTKASSVAGEEGEDEAEILRDMNANIAQVSIIKDTNMSLQIILKMDISAMKEDTNIPFIGGFLPNVLYLNSINKLNIDEQGNISTESESIQINGMTDEFATVILNALFNSLSQGQENEDLVVFFNDTMGELFKKVMNNIGLVGDAELDTENKVVVSSIEYGTKGVQTHKISLITRIDEEE